MKKETIVSYTREEIPAISDERLQEMVVLSQRPDREIDLNDIPEITSEQARHAVRGWENHPGRAKNKGKRAA